MRFPREFYIHKGATEQKAEKANAVAYTYELAGKFYAQVFYGKQSKPYMHYWYKTEEQRAKAIMLAFAGKEVSETYAAEQKEKRAAFVPSVKVGEVFRTCWGYDQTNVEFYEVVAFSGKTATLRELAVEIETTEFMQGNKTPMVGKYVGEPFKRRALPGGGFKISSCQYASPADFSMMAGMKVYSSASYSSYA